MVESRQGARDDPGGSGPEGFASASLPPGFESDEALDRFMVEVAPGVAAGVVAAAFAHALSLGLENAVSRQQADAILARAVLGRACASLLGDDRRPADGDGPAPGPRPARPAEPGEDPSPAAAAGKAEAAEPEPAPPAPRRRPGPAAEAFAQAAAIIVQDSADSLRHTCIIANCAIGATFARFIETGDPAYLKGLEPAYELLFQATMAVDEKVEEAEMVLDRLAPSGEPAA